MNFAKLKYIYIFSLIFMQFGCYTKIAFDDYSSTELKLANDSTYHYQNQNYYNTSQTNSYYYDTKPWWLIETNYFPTQVSTSYSGSSSYQPSTNNNNTSNSQSNVALPSANTNRNDDGTQKKVESATNNSKPQGSTQPKPNQNRQSSERNSDGNRGK